MRQFPGNVADLNFAGVIERSKVLLLVAQALPGVAGLELLDNENLLDTREGVADYENHGKVVGGIPAHERPVVAACHVWCLAELNAAQVHGKPIFVKAGSAGLRRASGGGGVVHFVHDAAMLRNIQHLIDVEGADATVPSDKEMIMADVRAGAGGAAGLDARIVAAMQTAYELAQVGSAVSAAITAAVCGEPDQLELLVGAEQAEALQVAAAAGQAGAVRTALKAALT